MKVSYDGDGFNQRRAAREFADFLTLTAETIRTASRGHSTHLDLISWDEVLMAVERKYADLMDALGLVDDDDELDMLDGEETDIDDTLHPLDPDNEFYEGFDDV